MNSNRSNTSGLYIQPTGPSYVSPPQSVVLQTNGTPATMSPTYIQIPSGAAKEMLREVTSPVKEILNLMFEADGLTGDRDVPFEELVVIDPQYMFFQDLGIDTKQINMEIQNARNYYMRKYGPEFDPETFIFTDGKGQYNNHKFYFYNFKNTIDYHVHYPTVDGGGKRYPVRDAGFAFIVGDPGIIAHGEDGGTEGRYIAKNNVILYRWLRIDFPTGTRLYHYRSQLPYKSCLQKVYHPELTFFNANKGEEFGTEAVGYGISGSASFYEKNDGRYRVAGRNVVTFPGYYDTIS